jgi:hypothetical protein
MPSVAIRSQDDRQRHHLPVPYGREQITVILPAAPREPDGVEPPPLVVFRCAWIKLP